MTLFQIDVVICTKDRYSDLVLTIKSLSKVTNPEILDVLIVENSRNLDTISLIHNDLHKYDKFKSIRVISNSPGLTKARNLALTQTINPFIVFLDDDVQVYPDFFANILLIFNEYPEIAGAGAIIEQEKKETNSRLGFSRLVCLVPIIGEMFYPLRSYWNNELESPQYVTWIPGCAMTFKRASIENMFFNESLENGPTGGYALGEDYDFTRRLSRHAKLLQHPSLKLMHKLSKINRADEIKMESARGRWIAYQDRYLHPRITILFSIILILIHDLISIPVLAIRYKKICFSKFTRLKSYLEELRDPKFRSPV